MKNKNTIKRKRFLSAYCVGCSLGVSHDPLHQYPHVPGTLGMVLSWAPTGSNWNGAVNALTVISSQKLLYLLATSKQSRREALGVLCQD